MVRRYDFGICEVKYWKKKRWLKWVVCSVSVSSLCCDCSDSVLCSAVAWVGFISLCCCCLVVSLLLFYCFTLGIVQLHCVSSLSWRLYSNVGDLIGSDTTLLYSALIDFGLRATNSLVFWLFLSWRMGSLSVVSRFFNRLTVSEVKLCSVMTTCVGRLSENPSLCLQASYLVDPASSHMLVSKIKPCMSKYKPH